MPPASLETVVQTSREVATKLKNHYQEIDNKKEAIRKQERELQQEKDRHTHLEMASRGMVQALASEHAINYLKSMNRKDIKQVLAERQPVLAHFYNERRFRDEPRAVMRSWQNQTAKLIQENEELKRELGEMRSILGEALEENTRLGAV